MTPVSSGDTINGGKPLAERALAGCGRPSMAMIIGFKHSYHFKLLIKRTASLISGRAADQQ